MHTIDQLVYISRSLLPEDQAVDSLNDITGIANRLNRENEITGALALVEGHFVQLLEGAPAALDLLLIHLHFDARHDQIEVVARERVPHRSIPDWGMIAPPLGHSIPPSLAPLLQTRPTQIEPWRAALIETVLA